MIKLWLLLINICKSPRSNTMKTILLIPLSENHCANFKTYLSFTYLSCNSFTWKWKFLSLTYMWPRLIRRKKKNLLKNVPKLWKRLFPFGKILYESPKVFQLLFLKITFIILYYQNKLTCYLDKNEQNWQFWFHKKNTRRFFCSM